MRIQWRIAALVTALVLLWGCYGAPAKEDTPRLSVVASFYPLYIAALNVIGDAEGVSLSLLAPPNTGCLHDYQTRPQDMVVLETADLFLVNGGGMESFLDQVMETLPGLNTVTASDHVILLPAEAENHGHKDAKEHDHGDVNPHAWVSIDNYRQYVMNIQEALEALDPGNAAVYRQNAARYLDTLAALRDGMRTALAPIAGQSVVTFHEAFAYFAEEFSLSVAGVIAQEPGVPPKPEELAAIITRVKEWKIPALFTEPQYDPAAARTIARETGARVYTLDPVATGELTPDAYEKAMRRNQKTLLEALAG